MSDIIKSSLKGKTSIPRLATVGNICVQWSNIEYQLAHIIWFMLGLNMETGKIITGGLDMQPRLNTAILLARHLRAPGYVIAELTRVRKEIQDGLDTGRNRAVHGVSFQPDDPDEVPMEMHRGKGPKTPIKVTTGELNKLGKDLNAIGAALLQLFNRMLADEGLSVRFAIARKMRLAASDRPSASGS